MLILNPLMKRGSVKFKNEKICASLVMVIFIGLLIIFGALVIPQIIDNISKLLSMLKNMDYEKIVNDISTKLVLSPEMEKGIEEILMNIGKSAIESLQRLLPSLMNFTVSVVNNVINFGTGLIITWYVLSEKSKIKI